jgi:hypothetical protein
MGKRRELWGEDRSERGGGGCSGVGSGGVRVDGCASEIGFASGAVGERGQREKRRGRRGKERTEASLSSAENRQSSRGGRQVAERRWLPRHD